MIQCLFHRDAIEFRFRGIQEWSARGGKPDPLDLVEASATHALMDGVVLTVDGQQGLALLASFSRDEFSGGDQAFLVRQSDGFADFHGLVSRFQSRYSNDSTHHEI